MSRARIAAAGLAAAVTAAAMGVAGARPAATPTGGIAQLTGRAGCVTETGSGGECADGHDLVGVSDLAISPDGKHVYAAASGSDAVVVFERDAATGALEEVACVSETSSDGRCVDGVKLDQVRRLTISPDGRNVYAASEIWNSDADGVAVLYRDADNGRLSPLGGFAGCVSEGGLDDGCMQAVPLQDPTGLAVSPDGRNVYVTSRHVTSYGGGVVTLARNTTTGELAYASGWSSGPLTAVTISPDGRSVYAGECSTVTFAREAGSGALNQLVYHQHPNYCVQSLVVSPDGGNVYLAGDDNEHGGINVTARNSETGVITQLPGTDGCFGTGANILPTCADAGPGLLHTRSVTISSDGRFVYGGGVGIVAFTRDVRGALTRVAGEAGCTRTTTFDAPGCALVRGVDELGRTVVSPDGRHLYAAATDGVVAFELLTAGKPVCENLGPLPVTNGGPLTVQLRCTDPDSDPLTLRIVEGPERGRLGPIDQARVTVVYTPPAGFQGKDVFSYTATDGAESSAAADVVLDVRSAGAPVADVLNPRVQVGANGVARLRIMARTTSMRGEVTLRARATRRVLGRGVFAVPAGRTKVVAVRLTKAALRDLRVARVIEATAILAARGSGGSVRTVRERVTLRAA